MANEKTQFNIEKQPFVNRTPFFYGWVIMGVGTLGMILTSPGQTNTVSIFIEHLIEDLNISRSLISTLYAAGTLVGGFSLPFWGKQIDQHGTRKIVTLVAVLFGLACIYMGFVHSALMVGLGFILIRMLGQGVLGLVSQTVINYWWVQKRGLIMGISGLLMALLGIGAFPNLVYYLISIFDWRVTYMILGLGLLLIMAPLGYLLFRNHPEDYHLQPDGMTDNSPSTEQANSTYHLSEENWTLKEAIQTRSFWLALLGIALFGMLSTGLVFHLVSIFDNRGLGPAIVATVYIPFAISAAITNLLGGYLADHIPFRYLLAFALFIQAGSLVLAQSLNSTGAAFVFGVLLGGTNGFARAVGAVIWPSFFGREHLGSIYGFTSAVTIFGAALGPLPFGFAFDLTGSYQLVLLVFAGVSMLFTLISLMIKRPKKAQIKKPAVTPN